MLLLQPWLEESRRQQPLVEVVGAVEPVAQPQERLRLVLQQSQAVQRRRSLMRQERQRLQ